MTPGATADNVPEPVSDSPREDIHGHGEADAEGREGALGLLVDGPHADRHDQKHGHDDLAGYRPPEVVVGRDGRERRSTGIHIPFVSRDYLQQRGSAFGFLEKKQ